MILVNNPLLGKREKELLSECIDTNWISSDGPFVKKFEEMFSKYTGAKYGISVCNGTVAIELALAAMDVGPGDEVILPAHTIISCVMGIIRRGATPVLVDVEPDTWTISPEQVKQKVNSKTKAIMPVHMFGHPCDMDPLLEIADKHNLLIIEDAAEVHGAEYKGRKCGSIGDISTFSFYANKIITTGEGGMVLTSNEKFAERAKSFRNLCFLPQQRFLHEDLGYNFRFTNLQAALGVAQMERVEDILKIKIKQGKKYREALKDIPQINLQANKEWAKPVYWVNSVLLKDGVNIDAVEWAKILLSEGIQTRPFFYPLNKQPVLNKMGLFVGERYPISEKISTKGLYLPSGVALTSEEQEKVINIVKSTLKKY